MLVQVDRLVVETEASRLIRLTVTPVRGGGLLGILADILPHVMEWLPSWGLERTLRCTSKYHQLFPALPTHVRSSINLAIKSQN